MDLSSLSRLENKLRSAQEQQTYLDGRLESIVKENETYRTRPTGSSGNAQVESERRLRSRAEEDLALLKEEFTTQLETRIKLALVERQQVLDIHIEKAKQEAAKSNEIYEELESLRLQLTAAEQIITENQEYKRTAEHEVARLREALTNRDKTVEKMIRECTLECEERIRMERTQAEKQASDSDTRIQDLQRETSIAKAGEERAKRQQQRIEIQLQNERETSGVSRMEAELNTLRRKNESLERLRREALDSCNALRAEQVKDRLEYERSFSAHSQNVDNVKSECRGLRQELEKATDKRHDLEDAVAQAELRIDSLKSKEGITMSTAIAEQAKRIEQTRAEAQHWKSKYEVVDEEHQKSAALLNDLYHKERLLNRKYRTETSTLTSQYESKLRKLTYELKSLKARHMNA